MTPIGVLKGLKTLQALRQFVDGGGILDVLAGVEFAAARKAFGELPLATDRRAQLYLCIGHLNSCYQASLAICQDATSNWNALNQITISQQARLGAAAERTRFVLCLIAVCYASLGEEALWRRHLDMAAAPVPVPMSKAGAALMLTYLLSGAWALEIPFVAGRRSDSDTEIKVTDEDVAQLRERLAHLAAS